MDGPPIDELSSASDANIGKIAIDRDAEVPIGVQLAWLLRSRIGEGELAPGQRLPGLRELAQASGVNVNTVRAVYQRLEREGLIDSQQGSGTFIAATPPRASAVKTIAASAAREARDTGVDPRAVAAALYTSSEPPTGPGEAAVARRRLLRVQIGALERTLGEMEVTHPGLTPTPAEPPHSTGPALLSAEELEQVRTSLVRRLAIVQSAIDARLPETTGTGDPAPSPAGSRAGAEPEPSAKPKRTQPRPAGPRPAPAGA